MRPVPVVILSHRKQEFLETCLASLKEHAIGLGRTVVMDDSGDADHHAWLDDHGIDYSVVDIKKNAGYLTAMNRVWDVARRQAADAGSDYVMLWEEDFVLTERLLVDEMAILMDQDPLLAQLNLQRQPVYRVERMHGYM